MQATTSTVYTCKASTGSGEECPEEAVLTSEVPDLELLGVLLSTEVLCPLDDTGLREPPVDAGFLAEDADGGTRLEAREDVLAWGVVFPRPPVPLVIFDPAPDRFGPLSIWAS